MKQLKCTVFAVMFLRLMFVNWHCSLDKFNICVRKYNNKEQRKVKEFSKAEFLVGHNGRCCSIFDEWVKFVGYAK